MKLVGKDGNENGPDKPKGPKRRRFTDEQKREILARIDAAGDAVESELILTTESISAYQIGQWRNKLAAKATIPGNKVHHRPGSEREVADLKREVVALRNQVTALAKLIKMQRDLLDMAAPHLEVDKESW